MNIHCGTGKSLTAQTTILADFKDLISSHLKNDRANAVVEILFLTGEWCPPCRATKDFFSKANNSGKTNLEFALETLIRQLPQIALKVLNDLPDESYEKIKNKKELSASFMASKIKIVMFNADVDKEREFRGQIEEKNNMRIQGIPHFLVRLGNNFQDAEKVIYKKAGGIMTMTDLNKFLDSMMEKLLRQYIDSVLRNIDL